MASFSFEVPLDRGCHQAENESLQDAFAKYRKRKKDALEFTAQKKMLDQIHRREPARMASLRKKFMETAMKYIGVPYARKYHPADSPTHNAKLFLDCCGLVRRVLKDLSEEFGFLIGPWNQAYMFDTLPIVYSNTSELEPGDLVFVSGIYHNPKAKKQHHNIVHVEIWLGEGEKVVGARWQRGRVQVHESYMFEAKAYHSMQYHFKSIDTWLTGECKSHCPEHAWQLHRFNPSKRSIFALGEGDDVRKREQEEEEEEEEEEAAYNQLELVPGELLEPENLPPESAPEKAVNTSPNSKLGRSFIVCGGNAKALVEQHLVAEGWRKADHKVMFTLKWTECKHSIDYKSFREGEQIVNHICNINLLTTKIGLLDSLSTYYRIQRPRIPLVSFFPQTFRLDSVSERDKFILNYKHDGKEVWICKPTGANRGRGIFLVRNLEQVLARLEQDKKCCKPTSRPVARIVQRYISNPLLLDGKKFDLRVYMLIVCCSPWLVLFREGYARLCCQPYDVSSDNLSIHLTNQYQQKKNPLYSEVKEDTVWDFKKLQEFLSEEYGLPQDWVGSVLVERMKTIMTICFRSVKHKLAHTIGCFELLGFDFMLDADFNVWLIEANFNPALGVGCDTLARISPSVVSETLDIAVEVFDKCRKSRNLYPLTSLQHFRKLFVN